VLSAWSIYFHNVASETERAHASPDSVVMTLNAFDKTIAKLEIGLHILNGRVARLSNTSFELTDKVKIVEICLNRLMELRSVL
jgi:hypothetical protein